MKAKFFFLLIIAPVFLAAQSDSIFVIKGELKNINGNIQKVKLNPFIIRSPLRFVAVKHRVIFLIESGSQSLPHPE